MMAHDRRNNPALLLDWLTPYYDLFTKLFLPEGQFRRDLIAHARISPGHRVLDLGGGTGTLAILIKQTQPEAWITAIDGDPTILEIAGAKAAHQGIELDLAIGSATKLPYTNDTFDQVLSSLVFSVLTSADKKLAVGEAYRVLRNGGQLLIADFSTPRTPWGRLIAPLQRRFEPIGDLLEGLLPAILRMAGFENVAEVTLYATILGTLSILASEKPE